MDQLTLASDPTFLQTEYLKVVDDYGPIGKGASQAHTALCENLSEYILNGPSFTPDHPYVAANELIAGGCANLLGLPVLDFRIVQMGTNLFFASSLMARNTWYPTTTRDLFEKCENRERAYDIVALDVWLHNDDRHAENLLVRCLNTTTPADTRHLLLLNDHSHCLLSPARKHAPWSNMLSAQPNSFVGLDFLREAIVEVGKLKQSIARVEACTNDKIESVVAYVPDPLLSASDAAQFMDYLQKRRDRLRQLFQDGRAHFPNLGEGDL